MTVTVTVTVKITKEHLIGYNFAGTEYYFKATATDESGESFPVYRASNSLAKAKTDMVWKLRLGRKIDVKTDIGENLMKLENDLRDMINRIKNVREGDSNG